MMRWFHWISFLALSLACSASGKDVRVQFVVSTPVEPDPPKAIYVSTSLDGWPEGGRELKRVGHALYLGEWELPAGTPLEYKFLREKEWSTVEKGPAGQEVNNRQLPVQNLADELVYFHHVPRWADESPETTRGTNLTAPTGESSLFQPDEAANSTKTGNIRVHRDVRSPQLDNERDIWVWLPPSYKSSDQRRYPVLYMHDGQNAFDSATAFIGKEWQADETATRLIAEGRIKELIIVAVANTPERVSEYTPARDKLGHGGDAGKYVAFLTETVKPMIDRTYRTRSGREHTGIAGSSLGGLVSLYAALKESETFGRAAALSPTLHWANDWIFAYARGSRQAQRPRIWIDFGTNEGDEDDLKRLRRMEKLLTDNGYRTGRDLRIEIIKGGEHNEAAWAERFDDVLQFLFPADHGG